MLLLEGVKYDQDKERYDLIDGYALNELAKVYTYGAQKYEDRNWEKGIKWSRVFAAIMRHLWKFWRAKQLGLPENDEESGLPHLAHAAWGCFALLHYTQFKPEYDDRPGAKDEQAFN